ncbi:hypothetical protein [Amaricoccus sp.]|uniref:hypothetical protein n=1 Tax=Amaricoccus sp. TaxID=1872485 RepID=UPI001B4B05E3|nr:hypothetical protein [Amaricoccus sp.]MBP7001747.1 hypothetical protein [Amaricoccus sp.]
MKIFFARLRTADWKFGGLTFLAPIVVIIVFSFFDLGDDYRSVMPRKLSLVDMANDNKIFVGDIAARLRFSVASAGLSIASFVVIVVSSFYFSTYVFRTWFYGPILVISVAGVAGFLGWWSVQWSGDFRHLVADCGRRGLEDCPLDRVAAAGSPLSKGALEGAQAIVSANWAAGLGAASVLFCLFLVLAVSGPSDLRPCGLRRRRRWFMASLIMASVLLSFSVGATRGFYTWSSIFHTKDDAAGLLSLADSVGIYWGSMFTATILLTGGAAAAGIMNDIHRVGSGETGTNQEYVEWLKREGLDSQPLQAILAIIVAAGPLLSPPALNFITGTG